MTSRELRNKFFTFFVERKHAHIASSPLIPADDPTLLFANAGMNQFKDVFLGKEQRSYKRAVTIQKCIRAGGKHNDLENVGFTQRHLTFFEMMGNFSFGDYFKKEAIRFAWDFLTKEALLPTDKLYASVFRDDQEAYDIWHKEIGVPTERIVRLGEADNFWQMGDVGPCGPCTEIYLDRGAAYGCGKADCAPGCSCDRFMEIWNNVFMQFDRQKNGELLPLKQTGVDTGMGLERLCVAVQKKDSVFDTDIFEPLIKRLDELTGKHYQKADPQTQAAFRVLCDHVRSSSFAIADGALPSNEGRGYVLRKIIRRAALFAQKLGTGPLFVELSKTLIDTMKEFYPELEERRSLIISVLTSEVEKFSQNLVSGQAILAKYLEESAASKIITGSQAFKLYDTYGFPLELTKVIAHEKGYTVDNDGFEKEMEAQRLQSGKKQTTHEFKINPAITTEFIGYQATEATSPITALIYDDQEVPEVPAGHSCWVITKQSPLYVECGGQISDTATITVGTQTLEVQELKKHNGAILARVTTQQPLKVGDSAHVVVDRTVRLNTMKNHTATHLLQAALMQILGKGVKQSGSLVTPDYLRFDFSYHENVTPEQIVAIEKLVNTKVLENIQVSTTETSYAQAVAQGVIAFFGEKYNPESVRVVAVPGFSAELCGGTHVSRTGDIGVFKITEITALSAGNRRVVAVTGPKALELYQTVYQQAKNLSQEFKVKVDQVGDAFAKQTAQLKLAQQEIKDLKKHVLGHRIPVWLEHTDQVKDIPYLFLELKNTDASELRSIAEELLKKKPGIYAIFAHNDGRVNFAIHCAQSYTSRVNLKSLLEWLKLQGLTGGGSNLALQGGGQTVDTQLAELIKKWLLDHIS